MESPVRTTIATYDRVAEKYSEYSLGRLSQYQLAKFISYLNGKRVLDVGCGSGRDTDYLTEEGYAVTGIDASKAMIELAREKMAGTFEVMDMMSLRFDNSSFDGIWCCASLFHLPKKDAPVAVGEFARTLKEGGVLYVSVKEGEGERMLSHAKVDNKPRFYAFYRMAELEDMLREHGFVILHADTEDVESVTWLNIYACKDGRRGSAEQQND